MISQKKRSLFMGLFKNVIGIYCVSHSSYLLKIFLFNSNYK
jgi:hypothetical protein